MSRIPNRPNQEGILAGIPSQTAGKSIANPGEADAFDGTNVNTIESMEHKTQ